MKTELKMSRETRRGEKRESVDEKEYLNIYMRMKFFLERKTEKKKIVLFPVLTEKMSFYSSNITS